MPESVSQDFVKAVLKIPGGSGDQITTYLKKLSFAASDGKPTEPYSKFRSPSTSGQSVATAIRHAFARLYVRNEYMQDVSDNDLQGLIMEETGQAHDALSVKRTLACINTLKKFADFQNGDQGNVEASEPNKTEENSVHQMRIHSNTTPPQNSGIGLNLGYTINLNLPDLRWQAGSN